MEFTFIIVEPAVPGNVGASARALKTMGFNSMIVINSTVHRLPEARWLAHGSVDVLEKIRVYDTLDEAVMGMDMVIGTTAKKRRVIADHYLCSDIPDLINSKSGMLESVALVFGREESGLTNEELKLCHVFSGIPLHQNYPSLNLSQSVMIYAWELSRFKKLTENTIAKAPAMGKYRRLRNMVTDLLQLAGYDKQSAVYCRIMERIEVLGDKDAGLLMSVCSKLEGILQGSNNKNNTI